MPSTAVELRPDDGVVQVLSAWFSVFGVRVLIALKLKGVEYEYLEQDMENKGKLLLESNPIYKKVPVLIHKGKPICESLIIEQYIDEVWPSSEQPLLPKDPYERAIARFWAEYIDKKVWEAAGTIVRSPAGEQREQGKKDLIEAMHTLEGALRDVFGGGPYFGGHHMGLVDVVLAPSVHWFQVYDTLRPLREFKIWEESNFPHLHKWAQLVLEHPSVKEAVSIAPPSKLVDFLRKWFGP